MDADADGVVKVNHVLKVIELLGKEHVKLSGKQINQIVDMLQKEEMLETESSVEKIMSEAAMADIQKKVGEAMARAAAINPDFDLTHQESSSKEDMVKEAENGSKSPPK